MKTEIVNAAVRGATPPAILFTLAFLVSVFTDNTRLFSAFMIGGLAYAAIFLAVVWISYNGFSDRREVIKREHSNRPQSSKGDINLGLGDDAEIVLRNPE